MEQGVGTRVFEELPALCLKLFLDQEQTEPGIEAATTQARLAVDELVRQAQERLTMAFDLGYLDFTRLESSLFLSELSILARSNLYGFALNCRVSPAILKQEAELLHNAGVTRVEIAPERFSDDVMNPVEVVEANFRQLRPLRWLHEAEIEVVWRVLYDIPGATDEDYRELVDLFGQLHHLPPPQGWSSLQNGSVRSHPVSPGAEFAAVFTELENALDVWRKAYKPRTLTFSRGPGFIRILDMRDENGNLVTLTLEGRQEKALDLIDLCCFLKQLTEQFPEIPEERMRRFLDRLIERKILCRTRAGLYQNISVRRRREDGWAAHLV
jgi:hypothetical protein